MFTHVLHRVFLSPIELLDIIRESSKFLSLFKISPKTQFLKIFIMNRLSYYTSVCLSVCLTCLPVSLSVQLTSQLAIYLYNFYSTPSRFISMSFCKIFFLFRRGINGSLLIIAIRNRILTPLLVNICIRIHASLCAFRE